MSTAPSYDRTGLHSLDAIVGCGETLRWRAGRLERDIGSLLGECAVALCYNGISYAVMMTTPADLEDFALGFSLSEGILERPEELHHIEIKRRPNGIEIGMDIAGRALSRLKERRRLLTGRSGCGLCGIESLQQLEPPLRRVESAVTISHGAIQRALKRLPEKQRLQAETGASHAAAWCYPSGEIAYLREDVGRHNALDKMIGRHQRVASHCDGFALVTSRASYEMVLKSASIGLSILVAVSAPTTLAVEYARRTGVTLVGFARAGRHEIYSGEQRIRGNAP